MTSLDAEIDYPQPVPQPRRPGSMTGKIQMAPDVDDLDTSIEQDFLRD